MRRFLVGLLTLAFSIALARAAFAQNAQITGIVKDQSGAVIPGATVTARNVETGFARGGVNVGAGGREYSNGFVVDGVNNTWAEMGEPRQNFAMDAIQEFKVSTSTYKAEYGLATGGLVSVVTKSGTNQIHGSGLLFVRDASVTAKEFFQSEKPDYRRYQYGGTAGGPIVKDKTHFFFAYEATNEN